MATPDNSQVLAYQYTILGLPLGPWHQVDTSRELHLFGKGIFYVEGRRITDVLIKNDPDNPMHLMVTDPQGRVIRRHLAGNSLYGSRLSATTPVPGIRRTFATCDVTFIQAQGRLQRLQVFLEKHLADVD